MRVAVRMRVQGGVPQSSMPIAWGEEKFTAKEEPFAWGRGGVGRGREG